MSLTERAVDCVTLSGMHPVLVPGGGTGAPQTLRELVKTTQTRKRTFTLAQTPSKTASTTPMSLTERAVDCETLTSVFSNSVLLCELPVLPRLCFPPVPQSSSRGRSTSVSVCAFAFVCIRRTRFFRISVGLYFDHASRPLCYLRVVLEELVVRQDLYLCFVSRKIL